MKQCSRCHKNKEETKFDKNSRSPSGYTGVCTSCRRKKEKQVWAKAQHKKRVDEIFILLKWFKSNHMARMKRENLDDSYVKAVITSNSEYLGFGDIPSWVVQIKKLYILLKRERKNYGKNGYK